MRLLRILLAAATAAAVVAIPVLFAIFPGWTEWPVEDRRWLLGGWIVAVALGAVSTAVVHHLLRERLDAHEEAVVWTEPRPQLRARFRGGRDVSAVALGERHHLRVYVPPSRDRRLVAAAAGLGARQARRQGTPPVGTASEGMTLGGVGRGEPPGSPDAGLAGAPGPNPLGLRRAWLAAGLVLALVMAGIVTFNVVQGTGPVHVAMANARSGPPNSAPPATHPTTGATNPDAPTSTTAGSSASTSTSTAPTKRSKSSGSLTLTADVPKGTSTGSGSSTSTTSGFGGATTTGAGATTGGSAATTSTTAVAGGKTTTTVPATTTTAAPVTTTTVPATTTTAVPVTTTTVPATTTTAAPVTTTTVPATTTTAAATP